MVFSYIPGTIFVLHGGENLTIPGPACSNALLDMAWTEAAQSGTEEGAARAVALEHVCSRDFRIVQL
jgi:hypothetical protein